MITRPLKFRIWDKQSKRFLTNAASLHCMSQWMVDAFTGEVYDAVLTLDGDHTDNDIRSLSKSPNYYMEGTKIVKECPYIIQQYTGLTDGKNQEIYEGDIIQYTPQPRSEMTEKYLPKPRTYDVTFENGVFWGHAPLYEEVAEGAVVVGNIFENPELLK
jgi:hypothetical protein